MPGHAQTAQNTVRKSVMATKKFAQKNKKNQTKLKISMKWYAVGKCGFDFRDQQPKIYTKDPSRSQNFVVQCY